MAQRISLTLRDVLKLGLTQIQMSVATQLCWIAVGLNPPLSSKVELQIIFYPKIKLACVLGLFFQKQA